MTWLNVRCVAKERCPYSHVQTGDVFHARQEELMNVVAEGTVVETPHVGAKVYIQITNVRTPEQVPSIVTTHFLLQSKDDELEDMDVSLNIQTNRHRRAITFNLNVSQSFLPHLVQKSVDSSGTVKKPRFFTNFYAMVKRTVRARTS